MTPTPEEVVAWLRRLSSDQARAERMTTEKGFHGLASAHSDHKVVLATAANLIAAQAETLRQMREALEEAKCYISMWKQEQESLYGPLAESEALEVLNDIKNAEIALALPIAEAEKQARSNAEKAKRWDEYIAQYDALRAAREASNAK